MNGWPVSRADTRQEMTADVGTGGEVLTDLGAEAEIGAVAIQSDGKIVAAGESGGDFALASV